MKWFVPGRLEVFGKHTDYAGGNSLLAAVERGVTATLSDASEGITVTTTALPDEVHLIPGQPTSLPPGHWGGYVQAAVERLYSNFGELKPATLSLDSDLPLASGMSSSSALVVAVALALADHNGLREMPLWQENIHDDIDLAMYLATIENGMDFGTLAGERGVGTFGGSEDHTAMLNCEAGKLTQFRFCPTRRTRSVALPDGLVFVITMSGVLAEKTGPAKEAYNQASLRTRRIVQAWNDATGREDVTIGDVLACDPDALEGLRAVVAHSSELTQRLTAFLTESEDLIPAAADALERGDLAEFGRLAERSQSNAEHQLENQIPETSFLARSAMELGAHGSAGFGAGFGGSVWALVDEASAPEFEQRWRETYAKQYPDPARRASTIITKPGAAARRVD